MSIHRKLLCAAALSLAAPLAFAQTSDFNVLANVLDSCAFTPGGGPSDVDFGTYDPTTFKDAQGQATVLCASGGALFVWISTAGDARQMTGPGLPLNYQLYLDAARTNVFPSAQPGTSNFTAAAGVDLPIDYYGRVPGGQFRAPGNYAQTATLNVNF